MGSSARAWTQELYAQSTAPRQPGFAYSLVAFPPPISDAVPPHPQPPEDDHGMGLSTAGQAAGRFAVTNIDDILTGTPGQ